MFFSAFHRRASQRRGFTLVELAIVLAVATTLFAGLWRLMSSGSTQLRDQAVAEQHRQLAGAVQNFLKSTQAQQFIQANHAVAAPNAGSQWELELPTTAGDSTTCAGASINIFCDYLPAGFIRSTTNAYGQTYRIFVNNGVGSSPFGTNYSFMIITEGGDDIPDTSGGRIASMIGNDGGFIYNTEVCGSPQAQFACGAYGAWSLALNANPFDFNTLGAGLMDVGHVVSRTMASQADTQLGPWLARNASLGADFNTMTTNLLMGTAGSPANIQMNGNVIALGGGRIEGSVTVGAQPTTVNAITGLRYMKVSMLDSDQHEPTYALEVVGAQGEAVCEWSQDIASPNNLCNRALWVSGNANVTKTLYANNLIAGSFIYKGSDERLKHDVKKITGALAALEKVRGVSYKLNEKNTPGMGVIAQELEKVYPDLVGDRGDGYKVVDYTGLLGPVIEAIHELKAENDSLREEIEKLKVEIRKKK